MNRHYDRSTKAQHVKTHAIQHNTSNTTVQYNRFGVERETLVYLKTKVFSLIFGISAIIEAGGKKSGQQATHAIL